MIKDIVKLISTQHQYRVTSDYWGRIGSMCKRYGEETVEKAVKVLPAQEIPLTQMLNIIEKKCQYIIENDGDLDELAEELLNG